MHGNMFMFCCSFFDSLLVELYAGPAVKNPPDSQCTSKTLQRLGTLHLRALRVFFCAPWYGGTHRWAEVNSQKMQASTISPTHIGASRPPLRPRWLVKAPMSKSRWAYYFLQAYPLCIYLHLRFARATNESYLRAASALLCAP